MPDPILICGVTGQDGALLAANLLGDGFEVHGTSRDAQSCDRWRLRELGIDGRVPIHSMAPNDFRSVINVFSKVRPSIIYNLAGQTSVGLSFDQPVESLESIVAGTLNLLEAIRLLRLPARLFNAGSSEAKLHSFIARLFEPRSSFSASATIAGCLA